MSGRRAAENIRYIPMTEEQRDYLDSLPSNDTLYAIVESWDAADPPVREIRMTEEERIRAACERQAKRREIASCATPIYHTTHRYCPSCPWTEAAS